MFMPEPTYGIHTIMPPLIGRNPKGAYAENQVPTFNAHSLAEETIWSTLVGRNRNEYVETQLRVRLKGQIILESMSGDNA